eukprot:scaffold56900_cov32-Phaeocystis_antarctica.AAC.1
MVGGAGGCRAVLRACGTMRAFLRARAVVWRARARVHAVSASDWDAASPMARLDPARRSCRAPRWRPGRDGPFNTPVTRRSLAARSTFYASVVYHQLFTHSGRPLLNYHLIGG